MTNRPYITHCGLLGIDHVPFGMHAFSNRDQIVAVLVPYAVEERARRGYNGLRITGNASFLTPGGWGTFMEYEQAVSARFNGWSIVALCSYAQAQCNDQQMSEVMHALEGPDAYGQVVPSLSFSGALRASRDLIEMVGGDSHGYNHSILARRRVRPGRAAGDVHRPG
jgi:DcmR-like sensory protein